MARYQLRRHFGSSHCGPIGVARIATFEIMNGWAGRRRRLWLPPGGPGDPGYSPGMRGRQSCSSKFWTSRKASVSTDLGVIAYATPSDGKRIEEGKGGGDPIEWALSLPLSREDPGSSTSKAREFLRRGPFKNDDSRELRLQDIPPVLLPNPFFPSPFPFPPPPGGAGEMGSPLPTSTTLLPPKAVGRSNSGPFPGWLSVRNHSPWRWGASSKGI